MAETITKRKNILVLLLAVSLLILLAVGLDLISPKNNNKVELNNENNQRPRPTDSVSMFKKTINPEDFCGGDNQEIIRNFSVDTQGNIYVIEASDNGIIQISPEGKALKNFYLDDLRCEKIYKSFGEYTVYITTAMEASKNYLYVYLQRMQAGGIHKIFEFDLKTGNSKEIWNEKMEGLEGSFMAVWDVDDSDNLTFVVRSWSKEKNKNEFSEIQYHQNGELSKTIMPDNIVFWQITKDNLFRHDISSYRTHDNSLYVYDLQNNFIRKFEPEHWKQKDDVFSWFGYDGNFYIIRKQPDNNFILERVDTNNNVLARTQARDYTRFNRNDVKMEIGFDGKGYIAYVDREQGIYGIDRYEF